MPNSPIDAETLCKEIAWIRKHEDSRRGQAILVMDALGCSTGKSIMDEIRFHLLVIKANLEYWKLESKKKPNGCPFLCSDAVLMSLGLLEGYEYNLVLIEDRQEAFLRKSDWLKTLAKPKWKVTYDDVSDEKKKDARESLTRCEWNYIKKVSEYITENIDTLKKYLDECSSNLKRYVRTVKNGKGQTVEYRIKAPRPFFVEKEELRKIISKDTPPEEFLQIVGEETEFKNNGLEDVSDKSEDYVYFPKNEETFCDKLTCERPEFNQAEDEYQGVLPQQDYEPIQEDMQSKAPETYVDNSQHNINLNRNNYGLVNNGIIAMFVSPQSKVAPIPQPSDQDDPYTSYYYEYMQQWRVASDLRNRESFFQKAIKLFALIKEQCGNLVSVSHVSISHIGIGIVIPVLVVVSIIAILVKMSHNQETPKVFSKGNSAVGNQRLSLEDTSSVYSSLSERSFKITDDDMRELVTEAQKPIEVLSESGEYDKEEIIRCIYDRIINNPVYGDMVLQGFLDADNYMIKKIGDENTWIQDFFEKTYTTVDAGSDQERNVPEMTRWLIKPGNQTSTNDEYKEYASFICDILDSFYAYVAADNFNSTCHWAFAQETVGTHTHATKVIQAKTQPAIIFQHTRSDGVIDYLIAFFLEDGSFATYNPWDSSTRSFTASESSEIIHTGWGDSDGGRPAYYLADINDTSDPLGNRIVFNSIIDSTIGDERNFVGACEDKENQYSWYNNDIAVENGKEYIVRLYVHNDNRGGRSAVAEDVRVAFALPEQNTYAKNHQINGFITSSNATPHEYWDTVNFYSDTCFKLTYVPGSAIINNRGYASSENGGAKALDDSIIKTEDNTDGVLIGFDSDDGKIPGCYGFDSCITIKVKVEYPDYLIQQKVRLAGTKTWNYNVEAAIGNKVEFQIQYQNLNEDATVHENVMIRDILPQGLNYVEGSTVLYNGNHREGIKPDQDDALFTTGINIGDYKSNANAYVRFEAEIVDNSLENGLNTLVNWGKGSVHYEALTDYATVMVYKSN